MYLPKILNPIEIIKMIKEIPSIFNTTGELNPNSISGVMFSPKSGEVKIPNGKSLIIEITFAGNGAYSLEVDHSLQGTLPEFSVYADNTNPYGTEEDKEEFEEAGVEVSYLRNKWTINFGPAITNVIRANPNTRFYFAVKDNEGNYLWGSMNPTTPSNTLKYTII